MISNSYKELIEKLIKGTTLKKVVWEKTSRKTEYKTTLGSSTITTDNWDSDGEECVDIAIWNDRGERVDTIAAAAGEDEDDYKEIMKLYSTARAAYLRVDETISEILSHLDF